MLFDCSKASSALYSVVQECQEPSPNTCKLHGLGKSPGFSRFPLFIYSLRMSMCTLSRVWLFVTPGVIAHQAPLSTGFPRQEYWSGLPFPLPEDLPNPGIEPASPACPALAFENLTTEPPGKPHSMKTSPAIFRVDVRIRNAVYSLWPYHPEHARSHLISEVKQGRAWLVLGWETAWEYRVL